jgi:predicted porin
MYKFGNTAGSTSAGSSYGFQLGYQAGDFEAQAAYSQANDVVTLNTAASSTTATGIQQNEKGYIVGLKYKFNHLFTGKSSYQRYTIDNPSNPSLNTSLTNY